MKTTDRVASVAHDEADQSVAGRRVGAGVLVVAQTLLMAAELISPINTSSDTAEEWYADVIAKTGRYSVTAVLLFTPVNVGRAVGAALLLTAMLPHARDALRSDNHQF